MKKRYLAFIIVPLLALCGCQGSSFNNHIHEYENYFDNGDGTHSSICRTDYRHKLTEDHHFDEGVTTLEPTQTEHGIFTYTCHECGATKIEDIKPLGSGTFVNEIVDDKYLYTKDGRYTNVYYKSANDGSFGDYDALFEHSSIPKEYSEIEYIKGDGVHTVDTGVKKEPNLGTATNIETKKISEIAVDLPDGYLQYEYLKGDSKSYIDTGILFDSSSMKYEMRYSLSSTDGKIITYGYCENENGKIINSLYRCNATHIIADSQGHGYYGPKQVTNIIYNETFSKDLLIVNEQKFSAKITSSSLVTFKLLGLGEKDKVSGMSNDIIYNFKTYNGDALTHYFVPAQRTSDHLIGMYDVIGNSFHENKGSGTFIKGQIVLKPSQNVSADESQTNLESTNPNIEIFKDNETTSGKILADKVSNFVIYNEHAIAINEFVSVVRNSDSKPGFYDLKTNVFIELGEGNFEIGHMVGHMFNDFVVKKEPTYKEEGLTERTCKLCGKVESIVIPRLSWIATFQKDDHVQQIDVYSDPYHLFESNASSAYSRSLSSYNYSKVNSGVLLKIIFDESYVFDGFEDSKITYKLLENGCLVVGPFLSDTTLAIKSKPLI